MKLIFCSLLISFFSLFSSSTPTSKLKAFVHDLLDKKLSNPEIGEKYFCTNILHRPDHYGEEARGYLEFALSHQRDSLQAKHVNPDEVSFTPYDTLPISKLPAKPFHMLSETKHVYVAQYQGKIILYFLLQEDKIASTLLIGQGDEHYFINLCD
jgi:hypothetical protein